MTSRRIQAIAEQRQAVLDYCRQLAPEEWAAPSRARGWQVTDVVAHFAATSRVLFGPGLLRMLRSDDVEAFNESALAPFRSDDGRRVLAAYRSWSGRAIGLMRASARGPVARLSLPLGNLGRYQLGIMPCIFVFDWHTHLAFDIAPVVDRDPPEIDDLRMGVALEWMLAGLEQMNRSTMGWVDRALTLSLSGPGAGTWVIEPRHDGLLRVRPGSQTEGVAHVAGRSEDFPRWATRRSDWRTNDLAVTGDAEYAVRFLDCLDLT